MGFDDLQSIKIMENHEIQEFDSGESITSPNFRIKLNNIVKGLKSAFIQPGIGYTMTRTNGGTTLNVKPGKGGSGGGETFNHPFKVFIRKNPDVPNQFQAGVYYYSDLMLSARPNDNLAITGLLDASRSTGWSDVYLYDIIHIQLLLAYNESNVSAITASIQSEGLSASATPWTTGSIIEENEDERQTLARYPLASIVSDGNGGLEVRQCVFTHLLLAWTGIYYKPALYPIPWHGKVFT
jgi:hypothetical protein